MCVLKRGDSWRRGFFWDPSEIPKHPVQKDWRCFNKMPFVNYCFVVLCTLLFTQPETSLGIPLSKFFFYECSLKDWFTLVFATHSFQAICIQRPTWHCSKHLTSGNKLEPSLLFWQLKSLKGRKVQQVNNSSGLPITESASTNQDVKTFCMKSPKSNCHIWPKG